MPESLLPPRFLFRFAAPCRYRSPLWGDAGCALGEEHRLPRFEELDRRPAYADLRAAWSEEGLAFWLEVEGKRQHPWCYESRPDESDGLRLWIDTRDTHDVHRATRFCHSFAFLPGGAGRNLAEPVAEPLVLHRAREQSRPVRRGLLQVRRELRPAGYVLACFVPAAALTGFDPAEQPRLGFNYAVVDRELGLQTFVAVKPFGYDDDPSLWGTLDLVRPAL